MFMNGDVMREYRFFPMDDAFITDKNVNANLYALLQDYASYSSTAFCCTNGKHQLTADLYNTPGCEELARLLAYGFVDCEMTGPTKTEIERELKYLLSASKTNPKRPYIIQRLDDFGICETYQFNLNFNKTDTLVIKSDIVDMVRGLNKICGDDMLKLYITLLKQFNKEGSSFIFTYDSLIDLLGGYRPKVRKFNMSMYLNDLKKYGLIDFMALTDDAKDVASYQLLDVAQDLPEAEPAPMKLKMKIELNADGTISGCWIPDKEPEEPIKEINDYEIPEPGMLELLGIEIDPECKILKYPFYK